MICSYVENLKLLFIQCLSPESNASIFLEMNNIKHAMRLTVCKGVKSFRSDKINFTFTFSTTSVVGSTCTHSST